MKLDWLSSPRHRLDVVAGLVDGILNALTLAAGKLVERGAGSSLSLVLKVGIATTCTTMFVFFVAHYAEQRTELVHAERELNLLSHGRLATTRLGQQVLKESLAAACIASLCGLAGSAIPLLLGLMLPGPPVIGLALSVGLLGILGALLARSFFGSPLAWSLALMAGGIILTFVGMKLNVVG
jgi:predicted membrane protein (TIGR00267 family)